MRFFFYIQCIIYRLNHLFLPLKIQSNFSNNKIIENIIKINNQSFYYPATHKNKYTLSEFKNLTLTLKDLLNKFHAPKNFIDIGAFIGLYGFIMNNLKKTKIFSFEPNKINFNFLKKNMYKKNSTIYNIGISDKNYSTYISPPKTYFNKYLQSELAIKSSSMKSIHNRKNNNSELCKFSKIDYILDKHIIINSYIKIDTEGHEFEILKYLSLKKLVPKILSVELNNYYLLKRCIHPKKYLSTFFNKKLFSYYIINKNNHKLKKINPDHLIKFLVGFKFNSLKNLVKNFVRITPCTIDLFIIRKKIYKNLKIIEACS